MRTHLRDGVLLLSILCCLSTRARGQPAPPDAPPPPRVGAGAVLPASPSELRGSSVSRAPGGKIVVAPKRRVVLNNLLVLRLNPVGLEDQIRLGYQQRLREPDTDPLTASSFKSLLRRDTFVFIGVAPRINPAFIKIGPSLEIQPVSIFNLRVGAEFIGMFSTFGFLQSYPSALDEYSDRLLADCASGSAEVLKQQCSFRDAAGAQVTGADEKRNYKAAGLHVMIEPLLQLKFGPIALRNKLAIEYWYMGVNSGDRVFYDVTLDTLVPANGWVLANDLDLMYVTKFGLTAGVRYSVVHPFYTAGDFRPGEDTSLVDNGHQRIGPILAFTFFDRGFTGFNKPTLLLIANWYLDHRYRTGQAPSSVLPGVFVNTQAMPYVILGFAFQSDLLNPVRTQ